MEIAFFKNYYIDNRDWIRFAVKWFLIAGVLGAVTYLSHPEFLTKIIEIFQTKFGVEPTRDATLARQIFLQNLQACALALFGGILLGITSFLIVFFNGFIIGFVLMSLLFLPGNIGRNIVYILVGLVPHGIFELPAFILASALGLKLGLEWVNRESQGHRWEVLKSNARRVLVAVPVIVVLLFIAAIVEVFVSGKLVSNFR